MSRLNCIAPLLVSLSLSVACGADSASDRDADAGAGCTTDEDHDDHDDSTGDTDSTGGGQEGDDHDDDSTGDTDSTGRDDTGDSTGDNDNDDTGGTGGDSGDSGPPAFDCEAGDGPVTVEGGGSYDTIADAVQAAPPDAVVLVCPGQYEESIGIERSITIRGAGSDYVIVESAGGPIFYNQNGAAPFLRFEGMTLVGGSRGIVVDWPSQTNDPVLEVEDLHITETEGIGLEADAEGYWGTVTVVDTRIDHVDGGASQGGLLVGGAVFLRRVEATMTDCVLEANTAQNGGGMYIWGADVTFIGGRVVGNSAEQGGGAVVNASGFPGAPQEGRLTIEDSDWGEGAAKENELTDVWCDDANDDAGFLGAKTNAVCVSDVSPCCL